MTEKSIELIREASDEIANDVNDAGHQLADHLLANEKELEAYRKVFNSKPDAIDRDDLIEQTNDFAREREFILTSASSLARIKLEAMKASQDAVMSIKENNGDSLDLAKSHYASAAESYYELVLAHKEALSKARRAEFAARVGVMTTSIQKIGKSLSMLGSSMRDAISSKWFDAKSSVKEKSEEAKQSIFAASRKIQSSASMIGEAVTDTVKTTVKSTVAVTEASVGVINDVVLSARKATSERYANAVSSMKSESASMIQKIRGIIPTMRGMLSDKRAVLKEDIDRFNAMAGEIIQKHAENAKNKMTGTMYSAGAGMQRIAHTLARKKAELQENRVSRLLNSVDEHDRITGIITACDPGILGMLKGNGLSSHDLEMVLTDKSPAVRNAALNRGNVSLAQAERAASDVNWMVRCSAVSMLGGQHAVNALTDENNHVRNAARDILTSEAESEDKFRTPAGGMKMRA